MTDEELIETLWKGEVTLSVVVSAAVRIQELVKERDDAEWVEVLRKTYQRAKEAEAKLAKAVEALRLVTDACDEGQMASMGAGGMTIDAQIRRSVYNQVPAWPIEEARVVLDELEEK
jgi:hypothetical protein